jgi:hypothetical protein
MRSQRSTRKFNDEAVRSWSNPARVAEATPTLGTLGQFEYTPYGETKLKPQDHESSKPEARTFEAAWPARR